MRERGDLGGALGGQLMRLTFILEDDLASELAGSMCGSVLSSSNRGAECPVGRGLIAKAGVDEPQSFRVDCCPGKVSKCLMFAAFV